MSEKGREGECICGGGGMCADRMISVINPLRCKLHFMYVCVVESIAGVDVSVR